MLIVLRMKKLIGLLSAMLLVSTIWAQTQEVKAKTLLDKVSAKTKSFKTVSVDFSYTLQNKKENIEDTFDGSLKLKGNKYNLSLMGANLIFDGKDLYNYMPDSEEVIITKPNASDENSIDPAKLLTIYETGFKYKYVADKTEAGKQLAVIDLYPIKLDGKKFHTVKLTIDKQKDAITEVLYLGKDGINYLIKVKVMKTDIAFADKIFTFNTKEHTDVEVIDQRK
ncbi:MAG TPA: cell envelope biogenesis protein LolA [Bacteroidales bacterium]|nr:cell envelope biogenesis protein LolA [Bacteroidales bacterium]